MDEAAKVRAELEAFRCAVEGLGMDALREVRNTNMNIAYTQGHRAEMDVWLWLWAATLALTDRYEVWFSPEGLPEPTNEPTPQGAPMDGVVDLAGERSKREDVDREDFARELADTDKADVLDAMVRLERELEAGESDRVDIGLLWLLHCSLLDWIGLSLEAAISSNARRAIRLLPGGKGKGDAHKG